ncbi:MAG: hypothetical protein ACR2PM_12560, partial [Hyphomicrobiales bacterium]
AIFLIYAVAAGSGSIGQLFVPGENSILASKPAQILGPAVGFLFDMLGGYVTVSVARIRPYLHAVLLIGVLLIVHGALNFGGDVYSSMVDPEFTSQNDLWELLRITLLLVAGVLAGAWLAVRRRSMA